MKRIRVMDLFWGDCLKVKDEQWKSFEKSPENRSCKVWVKRVDGTEQYAYFFGDGCCSLRDPDSRSTDWYSCRGEPLYDVLVWKSVEEPGQ